MKASISTVITIGFLCLALNISSCFCDHEITDCGGSYVSFSGQSDDSNNATLVPGGSFVLSVAAKNNQQIPAGVTLMKLVIRELDGVVVPCLDGISGSCQFDLCDFMNRYPDFIYPAFRGCPIYSAQYSFDITMSFDEIWLPIIGDKQNEIYTSRYELIVDEELVGCFEFPFTLTTD